jgi:hypothetical protein
MPSPFLRGALKKPDRAQRRFPTLLVAPCFSTSQRSPPPHLLRVHLVTVTGFACGACSHRGQLPVNGGVLIHTYTVPVEEDLSCPPLPGRSHDRGRTPW